MIRLVHWKLVLISTAILIAATFGAAFFIKSPLTLTLFVELPITLVIYIFFGFYYGSREEKVFLTLFANFFVLQLLAKLVIILVTPLPFIETLSKAPVAAIVGTLIAYIGVFFGKKRR